MFFTVLGRQALTWACPILLNLLNTAHRASFSLFLVLKGFCLDSTIVHKLNSAVQASDKDDSWRANSRGILAVSEGSMTG